MRKKQLSYSIDTNPDPSNNYEKERKILLKKIINLGLSNTQVSLLSISRREITRILYYDKIY